MLVVKVDRVPRFFALLAKYCTMATFVQEVAEPFQKCYSITYLPP